MDKIDHRDNLGDWLNSHGLTGTTAEIGCAFGGYSRILLGKWRGAKHYMVDPWILQPASVYREKTDDVQYDQWFLDCQALAAEDKRVAILRMYSVEGAKQMEDGSLDCVFIDGNHSYEAVLEDMDAWWPKVKTGGVFSGHDCYNDTNFPSFCEVKAAVERWTKEHGVEFYVTPCSSWWVHK